MSRRKKKQGFVSRISNGLFVVALACAMFFGLQVTSAFGDSLNFAQISDAHFSTVKTNTSYRLTADSADILSDVVHQVNAVANLDFVMFTGDMINTPYEKELNAFLPYANQLKYPWYCVFGNHDISIGGYLSKKMYMDILNSNNKHFNYKQGYYSFSPKKGFKIIALDSIIDDRVTANGRIDEAQLKWLDKQLSKSKHDTVLIFLHVPVLEPLQSSSHELLNANEVNTILKKYKNPIAVFSGHYHTTKITQVDNVLHVSTPSLISYPNAFRIVRVTNQKNKVLFDLYFKETGLKEVQTKAKLMAFGSKTYYGAEADRTATYEIKK